MDSVTQQNAALVEQAAAAAASLEEQTRQLKDVVAQWRLESAAPVRASASTAAARIKASAPAARIEPSAVPAPTVEKRVTPAGNAKVAPEAAVIKEAGKPASKPTVKPASVVKSAPAPRAKATTADDGDWETF
jgi:hypothetical protein